MWSLFIDNKEKGRQSVPNKEQTRTTSISSPFYALSTSSINDLSLYVYILDALGKSW